MANFPPALVAAALVGAADRSWLTALAIVATGLTGAILIRRQQIRGAR
jgi:hypothetical protein